MNNRNNEDYLAVPGTSGNMQQQYAPYPMMPYPIPNFYPQMPMPAAGPFTYYNFPPPAAFMQTTLPSTSTIVPRPKESTILLSEKFSSSSDSQLLANLTAKKVDLPSCEIKVWQMSKYFKVFHELVDDLREYVNAAATETTNKDWTTFHEGIQTRMERVQKYRNMIELNPTFMYALKYKISKRRRKRKLLKRKKLSREKPVPVHEIANVHRQHLEQIAENLKQEEKLKEETNTILSSVIQKKAEARYHIQLLNNLLKLHSARVHQLTVERQLPMEISVSGVQKILEKLKNLWQSKLDEYLVEESGLKLMASELAVNAEDEDCNKLKKTFAKWLKFIFGTADTQKNLFYSGYDDFVKIRLGWDKYVVEGKSKGSRIPPGWVIPKYNDNDSWRKFLSD